MIVKTKPITLELKNGATTLKPQNIKIIGVLDEDQKLGEKKARMITRFAQRSMKYSFIEHSPRNNSSNIKKQLFLGAEFAYEGIGSSQNFKIRSINSQHASWFSTR